MNEKSSCISYFIQFISIQIHFDSKFSYAVIYRNLQWCLWQQKTVRKKYESERSKRDRNTKDNFTLWKKINQAIDWNWISSIYTSKMKPNPWWITPHHHHHHGHEQQIPPKTLLLLGFISFLFQLIFFVCSSIHPTYIHLISSIGCSRFPDPNDGKKKTKTE